MRLSAARCLIALAFGCSTAALPSPRVEPVASRPDPIANGPRLPRTFVPVGYAAQLAIRDDSVLTGTIAITGDLAVPTDVVWLHGADLSIVEAFATRDGARVALDPRKIQPTASLGRFLALLPARPLAPGRWVITISYRGPIDDRGGIPSDASSQQRLRFSQSAAGPFREWVDGQPYTFTMLEPMYARHVFPCIDEPDRKVPWQLTLDVRADHIAASNTPIVRETVLPDGRKRIEFAPTPPLPSYLVAFAVGPFDVVSGGSSKSGIPIRILTQRGTSVPPWGAAAVAPIVDAAEAWFTIPLAYRKLDLIGVPVTGLRWIAMENPGLITFQSSLLTEATDQEHGDDWQFVVIHEVAHQWFGNLVTPAWWDDIWLNESFAVWLTDKLMLQFAPRVAPGYPTARIAELSGAQSAFAASTVRVPATALDEPARLAQYFNGARGAHVLAMVEAFVGPEVFQRAVRTYVRAHAHGTVTTKAFVNALDAASGKSLGAVIMAYVDQPGSPRIDVAVRCERDRTTLEITRQGPTWSIPVCVAYDNDGARADHCLLVDQPSRELVLATRTCPRWVMPNGGGRGLYASQWDRSLFDNLTKHGWPFLTPLERTAVLAEVGRWAEPSQEIIIATTLLASPTTEPVASDWAAQILGRYARHVPTEYRPKFAYWIASRFAATAHKVGFSTVTAETDEAQNARARVLYLLFMVRDPVLARAALPLVAGASPVPPALRQPLLLLATIGDTTLGAKLLQSLPQVVDRERRRESISVLVQLEQLATLIRGQAASFAVLDVLEQRLLLGAACDIVERDAYVDLINQLVRPADRAEMITHVRSTSNLCIAERVQLEPVFRRWLLKVR